MFGRNKQIKDVIEDGHKRKRKDMEGAKTVSNAGNLLQLLKVKDLMKNLSCLKKRLLRSIEMSSMAILSLEIQKMGMK